ncbi:MAG TPA: hypothetical protein VJG90_00310 [Candidatus Nanoarchaeia archaeon]|nr:hypothetical protein [Candidatus Nanoarchaeia archaeon]
MKTKHFLSYLCLFVVLNLSVQAASCETQEELTKAFETILTVTAGTPPPTLLKLIYTPTLIQRVTDTNMALPSLICDLDLENELSHYQNKMAGTPLQELAILDPPQKHEATYLKLAKGKINAPEKGEITYDLILPSQDIKQSLKEYTSLSLFSQFTVPDDTRITKKYGKITIASPKEKPIALGSGQIVLNSKPLQETEHPFSFADTFTTYPFQSRVGEPIYSVSFVPVKNWQYLAAVGSLQIIPDPDTTPLLGGFASNGLALITTSNEALSTPATFTITAPSQSGTHTLYDTLEVYESEEEFKPFTLEPTLIELTPTYLFVANGRIELSTFQKEYGLKIQGSFGIHVVSEGVHVALHAGELELKRKDRGDVIQLSSGSLFFYPDGNVAVFGIGKLVTTKETFTFDQDSAPNSFKLRWYNSNLMIQGNVPFESSDDPYMAELSSERIQLLLPYNPTITQTTEGYELIDGAQLNFREQTALNHMLNSLSLVNNAKVNHALNEFTLNTDPDSPLDQGFITVHSGGQRTDILPSTEPLRVLFEPSTTETHFVQLNKGKLQRAQGAFKIIQTPDLQAYESDTLDFQAQWDDPTLSGAPRRFRFKTTQDEEEFFTLTLGNHHLVFSIKDNRLQHKKTTPEAINKDPVQPLLIEGLNPDGELQTRIYYTLDRGLYPVQPKQSFIDFVGSQDKQRIVNPYDYFHREYTGLESNSYINSIQGDLLAGYPTREWIRTDGKSIALDIGPLHTIVEFLRKNHNYQLTLAEVFKQIDTVLVPNSKKESAGFGSRETQGQNTEQGYTLITEIRKQLEEDPDSTSLVVSSSPEQILAFAQILSDLGLWYDYEAAKEILSATVELQTEKVSQPGAVTPFTSPISLMAYSTLPEQNSVECRLTSSPLSSGYECQLTEAQTLHKTTPLSSCTPENVNSILQYQYPIGVGKGYYHVYLYPYSTQKILEKNPSLLQRGSLETDAGLLREIEGVWKEGAILYLPAAGQGSLLYKYFPKDHPKYIEGFGDEMFQEGGKIQWEPYAVQCQYLLPYLTSPDQDIAEVARQVYDDPKLAKTLYELNQDKLSTQDITLSSKLPSLSIFYESNLADFSARKRFIQARQKIKEVLPPSEPSPEEESPVTPPLPSTKPLTVIDLAGKLTPQQKKAIEEKITPETTVIITEPGQTEAVLEQAPTPKVLVVEVDDQKNIQKVSQHVKKTTSCGGSSLEPFDETSLEQEPAQFYTQHGEDAVQLQQKIVEAAKQEGIPSILALAIVYTESFPKFEHYESDGKTVIDSGTGSKGLFQTTHRTAYGKSAPADYRGKGSRCQADYWNENNGICQGLDFCEPQENVQCGLRIFKKEIEKSQSSYEGIVRTNCKKNNGQDREELYLSYSNNKYARALQLYNGVCAEGLGDDKKYVSHIAEAVRFYQGKGNCQANEICKNGACVSKCEDEKGSEGYRCICSLEECDELGEQCTKGLCPGKQYCCYSPGPVSDPQTEVQNVVKILSEPSPSSSSSSTAATLPILAALASLPALPPALPPLNSLTFAEQQLSNALDLLKSDFYNRNFQQIVLDLSVKRLQGKQKQGELITNSDIETFKKTKLDYFTHHNTIKLIEIESSFAEIQEEYYERARKDYQEAQERYDAVLGVSGFTSAAAWGAAAYDIFLRESKPFDPILLANFDFARRTTLLCLEKGKTLLEIQQASLNDQLSSLGCVVQGFQAANSNEPPNPLTKNLNAANARRYMHDGYTKDPVLLMAVDEMKKAQQEQRIPTEVDEAQFLYNLVLEQGTGETKQIEAALGTSRTLQRLYGEMDYDPAIDKILRKNQIIQSSLSKDPTITEPYYKSGLFQCAHGLLDVKFWLLTPVLGGLPKAVQIGVAVPIVGYSGYALLSKQTHYEDKIAIACGIVAGIYAPRFVKSAFRPLQTVQRIQIRVSQTASLLERFASSGLSFVKKLRFFSQGDKPFTAKFSDDVEAFANARNPADKNPARVAREALRLPSHIELESFIGKPLLKTNLGSRIRQVFRINTPRVRQSTYATATSNTEQFLDDAAREIYLVTDDGTVYALKNVNGKARLFRLESARMEDGKLVYRTTQIGKNVDESTQALLDENLGNLKSAENLPTRTPKEIIDVLEQFRVQTPQHTRSLWEQRQFKDEPEFKALQQLARENPAWKAKIDSFLDEFYVRIQELLKSDRPEDREALKDLITTLKSAEEQGFLPFFEQSASIGVRRPDTFELSTKLKDPILNRIFRDIVKAIHPDRSAPDTARQALLGDELPRLQIYVREAIQPVSERNPLADDLAAARAVARTVLRRQLAQQRIEERARIAQEALQKRFLDSFLAEQSASTPRPASVQEPQRPVIPERAEPVLLPQPLVVAEQKILSAGALAKEVDPPLKLSGSRAEDELLRNFRTDQDVNPDQIADFSKAMRAKEPVTHNLPQKPGEPLPVKVVLTTQESKATVSVKTILLDTSSKESNYQALARYLKQRLGIKDGDVLLRSPSEMVRSVKTTNTLMHVDLELPGGIKKGFTVKLMTRYKSLERALEVALKEIEAVQVWRKKGANVPEILDFAIVKTVVKGPNGQDVVIDTVMLVMERAPGQVLSDTMLDYAQRKIPFDVLLQRVKQVARTLAQYHSKPDPDLNLVSSFPLDAVKARQILKTLKETETIPKSDYNRLFSALNQLMLKTQQVSKTRVARVMGDAHPGQFSIDGDEVHTFDLGSTFDYVSGGGKAYGNPGVDHGRFIERLNIGGKAFRMSEAEVRQMEEAAKVAYREASPSLSVDDFENENRFYQLLNDLAHLNHDIKTKQTGNAEIYLRRIYELLGVRQSSGVDESLFTSAPREAVAGGGI